MARLPEPGKDVGTWGIILNDFLNQSHNADGSIKDNIVTPAALVGNIPQTKIENLQTDLSSKVDKIDSKGLSTNDYTTAEKSKLEGIAERATNLTLGTTAGTALEGNATATDVGAIPIAEKGVVGGVASYDDTVTSLAGKANASEYRKTELIANAPNFIQGYLGNDIASDLFCCTISGGGSAGRENVIGGNEANVNTDLSNKPLETGTNAHYSVINGGYDNVANGLASILSGFHNLIAKLATHGTISGGSKHKILKGNYNTIAGGTESTIDEGNNGTISGGATNFIQGAFDSCTIGGGFTNIIKNNFGTICGGYINKANGVASTVGGGSTNKADKDYCTVAGGYINNANNPFSTISGGSNNSTNGDASVIVGGQNNITGGSYSVAGGYANTASGNFSVIVGGTDNTASGSGSIANGKSAKAVDGGQIAHANGKFANQGDAQNSKFVLRNSTTDATPTVIGLNGTVNLQMPIDSTWYFKYTIVARRQDDIGGESKAWTIEGLLQNNTSQNVTAIGIPTKTTIAGTAAWDITLGYGADTFYITATGEVGKTIYWVGKLETVEVVG